MLCRWVLKSKGARHQVPGAIGKAAIAVRHAPFGDSNGHVYSVGNGYGSNGHGVSNIFCFLHSNLNTHSSYDFDSNTVRHRNCLILS